MMSIESWMINLAIAIGGIVFGYGLFKGRIQAMDDRAIEHSDTNSRRYSDLERQIANIKLKAEETSLALTVVSGRLEKAISLEQAEAKFVSKLNYFCI